MSNRAPKRPTIKDVANEAGVAPMTVSHAFNHPERVADETRERVLASAARLGYHPDQTARALRSGRTRQLGVVVGEHLSYVFDDPQAVQFLAGVADVCVADDLGVVLIPTVGDERDVERVLNAAVDGYVLWTTSSDDPVLPAVAASGRPAAIQGGPPHPGLACIGPDDRTAADALATDALSGVAPPDATPVIISFPVDRRRAEGIVTGADLPDDLTGPEAVPFPVTGARLAGYRDAITRAGLDWERTRIAIVSRNVRQKGESACRALLADATGGAPGAVLTMSDQLAMGAHRALVDLPTPVVVTGWDASPDALGLGIWSVSAPLREQGRACARAALTGETGVHRVPWQLAIPSVPDQG